MPRAPWRLAAPPLAAAVLRYLCFASSPAPSLTRPHSPALAHNPVRPRPQVAVLERINPQGLYSTRLRRLGEFGAASLRASAGDPRLGPDIPDPLYAAPSGAAERAALRDALHRIAFAVRGLVHCLAQLRARWAGGAKGLAWAWACFSGETCERRLRCAALSCTLRPCYWRVILSPPTAPNDALPAPPPLPQVPSGAGPAPGAGAEPAVPAALPRGHARPRAPRGALAPGVAARR